MTPPPPPRIVRVARREPPPRIVRVTRREFDEMPEYSASIPTGTTIGKRWRRNANAYRRALRGDVCGIEMVIPLPEDWWMGEFVPSANPEVVGIRWSRIAIVDTEDAGS